MIHVCRRVARAAASLLSALLFTGCSADRPGDGTIRAAAEAGDWFVDRAAEYGLDFIHFNGMSGEFYYPEIMGPGVALLDYDNDGDLDVYIVQGQMLGDTPLSAATFPPPEPLRDRLFRNDLTIHPDGTRTVRFVDVTNEAGIDVRTYGMGVAVGDYTNNGYPDIYRTGLNGSVLLRNNGDGTFTDVTAESRTGNPGGWGVSAAFVDINRNGWLDLFVGNYLVYSLAGDLDCLSVAGQRDYCPPNSYRAQPDRLYRNDGDGTFTDITSSALIGGAYGPALGVSTADFNGDGWMDIYVANDGEANQLWINQRDGTFRDTALLAGAAVNADGNAEAGMGVDAGDFDNNGSEDLFLTHWTAQTNTLYVNDGTGNFLDQTARSGLGPPSLAKTGFGTAWFDYDNDGWLDLLVVNGGVAVIESQARAEDKFPLRQTDQLFRNLGNGRFEDVSARAGAVFTELHVGRGAAFGDIDNDGGTDVVVANTAGPVQLLINVAGNRNRWLGLRLVGGPDGGGGYGRRDMLGARVEIVRDDGPPLWRRARSDGSYASANDPRVLVGLGASAGPQRVRVHWPSGRVEEWRDLGIDRYHTLVEGSGQ
jgi:enediyne biosynthesis protein E4